MKDTVEKKSLFTQVDIAVDDKKYDIASDLQKEMTKRVDELTMLYNRYKKNIF